MTGVSMGLICSRTHCSLLLPLLSLIYTDQLLLVPLEVRFKLGCPMKKFIRHAKDFTLDIVLVALDFQDCVFTLAYLFQD